MVLYSSAPIFPSLKWEDLIITEGINQRRRRVFLSRRATSQCSLRGMVPHPLQELYQIRPARSTQKARRRRPRPHAHLALVPLGCSFRLGDGSTSGCVVRRANNVECYDAQVRIAEAAERIHRSIVRLGKRCVAHPRHLGTQWAGYGAEMPQKIPMVARHVSPHAR